MTITYEAIPVEKAEECRELCNELMVFQKSRAHTKPELFDSMNFDTRMVPSIESALHNHVVIVRDGDEKIGYVYSNVSPKEAYSNDFATFFDLSSVNGNNVGWLDQFDDVEDRFIFVSNGNDDALEFYKRKGFVVSHKILEGFITVLRK